MRLQFAHVRVVPPLSSSKALPLPTLIACIEDRVEAVRQGATNIGCLTELLEQALPHLQSLQRLEASSVL